MADTNLNILVRVEGAKQASTEISQVSHSTAQVGKQTEEATKKTRQMRGALGGLATGFLVYKGAQWIKGAVTQTNELARSTFALQKITGMDAKTAAGWVALAKERGIQARMVNMSFITLAKNTEKLQEHNKKAIESFHKLGVNVGEYLKMKPEDRMLALADAFQHMRDPAHRAPIAQQLFGRQAQTMIPLLSRGRKATAELVGEMGKASGVTNSSVKEQMKLVIAQRQMSMGMLQLKGAVAQALAPVLIQLAKILAPLTAAFAGLMQKSGAFRIAVVALTAGLIVFIATMWLATTAGLAFLATVAPWLAAIVALGVGFTMLYQKVKWFRDGVNATWSWIKAHWPLLVGILTGVIGFAVIQIIKHWGAIRRTAEAAFNAITGAARAVARAVAGAFNSIKSVVEAVAKVVTTVFGGAFKAVETTVLGVVKAIEKMIDLAKKAASLPGKAASFLNPFGGHFLGGQTGLYMGTAGGGAAIVGEQGPEMVHLPQGARVSPFVQSYAGAGGPTTIQVPVYLDGRQIALAMGAYTADQKARR